MKKGAQGPPCNKFVIVLLNDWLSKDPDTVQKLSVPVKDATGLVLAASLDDRAQVKVSIDVMINNPVLLKRLEATSDEVKHFQLRGSVVEGRKVLSSTSS